MCRVCVCVGVGISPKFKNSEDGTQLVSCTFHHHPLSLIKVQGAMPHPLSSPLIQLTSRVHTTQCIMYWTGGLVYVLGWCI